MDGHAAELFFRVENLDGGWFAKGNVSGGFLGGGHLADEDFVSAGFPVYSRTLSSLRDGKLAFVRLDGGHEFWRDDFARVGAFVGYQFYREITHAFGCTQTAANDMCLPGEYSADLPVLAEENNWHSIRVGLSAQIRLIDRLRLETDAAFAYSFLRGEDHHIQRYDINPLPLHGRAPGGQFEAVLRYPVTDSIDFGVGGRYWAYWSDGQSLWSKTVAYRGGTNKKTVVWSWRSGVFAQVSVKLDAVGTGPQ